jgi:opacity protein-like surface antigen
MRHRPLPISWCAVLNNWLSDRAKPALLGTLLMLSVASAEAGFPLSTEDTGTLGLGRSKIELTIEHGADRAQGVHERGVVQETAFVHGLLANFNGSFTLPYRDVRSDEAGATHSHGVGDAKFGLKWRYFEQQGLSLGLKAVLTLPTGDAAAQLGSGKSTQAINAITSYESGPWEFDLDLGYKRNGNTRNQREHLGSVSVALVRSLDSRWKVMADIGVASNKNKASNQAPVYLGAGLSFAVTKAVSVDVGVKRALTAVETDFTGLAGLVVRF